MESSIQPTFDYNSLDSDLRIALQKHEANIRAIGRKTTDLIIEMGREFGKAKALCAHGEFTDWAEARFPNLSMDTIQNYMRMAELVDQKPEFSVFDPSVLGLLAKRSTPEKAREKALELVDDEREITVKVVVGFIAEAKGGSWLPNSRPPGTEPEERPEPPPAEPTVKPGEKPANVSGFYPNTPRPLNGGNALAVRAPVTGDAPVTQPVPRDQINYTAKVDGKPVIAGGGNWQKSQDASGYWHVLDGNKVPVARCSEERLADTIINDHEENEYIKREWQRRENLNQPSQAAQIVQLNEQIKGQNAHLEGLKAENTKKDETIIRLTAQINGSNKLNGNPSLPALALRLKMHPIDLTTWIETNSRKGNDKSKKPDSDMVKKQLAGALDFCLMREFQPEHNLIDIVSAMFELTTTVKKKVEKKPTTPASDMNPMKDAIAAAFGWEWDQMPKATISEIQAAAKELCLLKAKPEQIIQGYQFCKERFETFRPGALVKWYPEWVKCYKTIDRINGIGERYTTTEELLPGAEEEIQAMMKDGRMSR